MSTKIFIDLCKHADWGLYIRIIDSVILLFAVGQSNYLQLPLTFPCILINDILLGANFKHLPSTMCLSGSNYVIVIDYNKIV